MKRIKIVIFDLDGTLVDAYRAVSSSLNFALNEMGFPSIDDQTIKRSVGWGDRNLLGQFIPEAFLDRTLALCRRHHKKALARGTKFLPGAKPLIRSLREQGYHLAIASNRPTRFTNIILKNLGIKGHFHYVLCADKVKRGKPHPDILDGILRKLKLKPHHAVYVGDMAIDIQAGKNAGIKTVSVVTGSCTKRELAAYKPYKIITRIIEIKGVLDQLNSAAK